MDLKQIFVIYIASFFMELIKVYPDCKVQIATPITDKALLSILVEYSNFADIFSKKYAIVSLEYTEIIIYAIHLEKDK